MSEKVKPALTADEWKRPDIDVSVGLVWVHLEGRENGETEAIGAIGPHLGMTWNSVEREATLVNRHAIAALALHGQPFGFTREDVQDCRDAGDAATSGKAYPDELWGRMNNLAARIEALLPPEDAQ